MVGPYAAHMALLIAAADAVPDRRRYPAGNLIVWTGCPVLNCLEGFPLFIVSSEFGSFARPSVYDAQLT